MLNFVVTSSVAATVAAAVEKDDVDVRCVVAAAIRLVQRRVMRMQRLLMLLLIVYVLWIFCAV